MASPTEPSPADPSPQAPIPQAPKIRARTGQRHRIAKRRRIAIVGIVLALSASAAGLTFAALGDGVDHYRLPADVQEGRVEVGRSFRLGGLVEHGSVETLDDGVRFNVADQVTTVTVIYRDMLPSLFKEGQGVVVTGVLLADGSVEATKVLAKHDETYMSPEVAAQLEAQGHQIGNAQLPDPAESGAAKYR